MSRNDQMGNRALCCCATVGVVCVVVLLLFVVCCLLFVVCCLLFVVCCLLFVVSERIHGSEEFWLSIPHHTALTQKTAKDPPKTCPANQCPQLDCRNRCCWSRRGAKNHEKPYLRWVC